MIKKIYTNLLARSPWENDDQTENIFTKKRKGEFNFNDFQFNFNLKMILAGVGLILLIALLQSVFYKVDEGHQSLVLRFGKFHRVGTPGLNYRLPFPIETLVIENVDQSRRLEVGYRSTGAARFGGAVSASDIKAESIMLTGDENIISLYVDVTWHIIDLPKYVFNIADPQDTVKASAESAIREVVGNTPISAILSNKKQMIADKIEEVMQSALDQYQAGVMIEQVKLLRAEPPEEVIAAYRDVQTAKADKEKVINESEAYENDILPRARGEAAKIVEEGNAYKAEVVSRAKGDTSRFEALYNQYVNGKEVTKSRLSLEVIESILQNSDKVIMGGNGVLPHMAIKPKDTIE